MAQYQADRERDKYAVVRYRGHPFSRFRDLAERQGVRGRGFAIAEALALEAMGQDFGGLIDLASFWRQRGGMIEDRKITERTRNASGLREFKRAGPAAVRAALPGIRPYIKQDLAVVWLGEQEKTVSSSIIFIRWSNLSTVIISERNPTRGQRGQGFTAKAEVRKFFFAQVGYLDNR
ncbi:MAG: hypothetical protein ACXWJN_04635 [Methyloceanibacter sp.]